MRSERPCWLNIVFFAWAFVAASPSIALASDFTVGGMLAGLVKSESITLELNGKDQQKLAADGPFTFKTKLAFDASYAVRVSDAPEGETCDIAHAKGTVEHVDVKDIDVVCTVKTYTIGGDISGLGAHDSVTLELNHKHAQTFPEDGPFTFAERLDYEASYDVTVSAESAGQTCSVTAHGSGTVLAADVKDLAVTCKAKPPETFSIGGTIAWPASGVSGSVTLGTNGETITVAAGTASFVFPDKLALGTRYSIGVTAQPTNGTCTVTSDPSGTVTGDVTNVVVTCTLNTYSVSGSVNWPLSGVSGSVTLGTNGESVTVADGTRSFIFPIGLVAGTKYSISVTAQPTNGTCTVTNDPSGTVKDDITDVVVTCVDTYTVGGTVSWPATGVTGSVALSTNGETVTVAEGTSSFIFPTGLVAGTKYSISVTAQPTDGACTVANDPSGTVTGNIADVVVTCVETYTIGGTVSWPATGVTGSVTLSTNGESVSVTYPNTTFTFPAELPNGASYNISVTAQPTGTTCAVTYNPSGTIASNNIYDVAVTCAGNGSGGGGFWIPYSATPPQYATGGTQGLFLVPSNQISTMAPPTPQTAQWVALNESTQLLGLGLNYTKQNNILSYSPQLMMYAAPDQWGNIQVWGLKLNDTSTFPTPTQIGNLSLNPNPSPTSGLICGSFQAQTNLSDPTTLFVVLAIGYWTEGLNGYEEPCSAGLGLTYAVVNYTDSATTPPAVVDINPDALEISYFDSLISPIYQDGTLAGMYTFDATTGSVNLYPDKTFTSPTALVSGLIYWSPVATVQIDDGTEFGAQVAYFSTSEFVSTTENYLDDLYRIDSKNLTATEIPQAADGSYATDKNNLYFTDTSSSTNTIIYQVPLAGGTPMELYSGPATVTTGSPAVTYDVNYHLIGTNDSLLAFTTSTSSQSTSNTVTNLYTLPVGTASASPALLAGPFNNQQISTAVLAPATAGDESTNVLFVNLNGGSSAASSFSIALDATSAPQSIANSVYQPIAGLTYDGPFFPFFYFANAVWQVTGITDTNGGWGTGTANLVDTSTLADTPFTTTGGGDFTMPAGSTAALYWGSSSDNISVGVMANPTIGLAVDLTNKFILPISFANTNVAPVWVGSTDIDAVPY